jgi:formylmethanofuran dehydrogenase subunit C
MSGLIFKLKSAPAERLDLSALLPALLAGHTLRDIEHLIIANGKTPLKVADIFTVSGTPGETIRFEGGSERFDNVGAGLNGGHITVDGHVGSHAGRGMKTGRIDITGNAGNALGSGLAGGVIALTGSTGDYVGAVGTGRRFGMTGGTIVIGRDCGERAGDKMRRGTIIVRGKVGSQAGSRMVGGTIIAEGGLGPMPGSMMRRGTLIAPSTPDLLPTFGDCGLHDLVILRVMARAFARELGPLAPRLNPIRVRRFAGDLATIGKGEVLIAA